MRTVTTLVVLAALAVFAYAPAQLLPFISDDYVQLAVARDYGAPARWAQLSEHPLYRFRAVSVVLSYWTETLFGLKPLAFNLSSLLMHVLCVWGVAALGFWKVIGWRVSIPAAAFFAIAERQQEAVIWYAAIPELNVLLFLIAAFLCWVRWLESPRAGWYFGAVVAFLLALLSKESGVALVGFQALAVVASRRPERRHWVGMLPFAGLACAYFALIYTTRGNHLHFGDGTFSLGAPFWTVLGASLLRLLWVWGFVALATLWWFRRKAALPIIGVALAWGVIGLLPYSFLTYMPRVPSRHTYLASVGLALLVGAAFAALRETARWKPAVAALALAIFVHNIAYLWTYKHKQYARRAEVTEELIRIARSTSDPIRIECFPFPDDIAVQALRIGADAPPERLIFDRQPTCTEEYRFTVLKDVAQVR